MRRTPNVLLVEDDPLTAFTTARSLRRSGYVGEVTVATDGLEAYDLLRSGRFALDDLLVLTDLSMPRMSGLELAAAIRAHPALCHQAVVVLTTSVESGDRAAAVALGVRAFFVKSNAVPHLADLIDWLRDFRPTPEPANDD